MGEFVSLDWVINNIKIGDLIEVKWSDEPDSELCWVTNIDRGFLILKNSYGKKVICRPNSLDYIKIIEPKPLELSVLN